MSDLGSHTDRHGSHTETLVGVLATVRQNPIAGVVAAIIIAAIGYQAVVVASAHSLPAGIAVLVVGYASFRFARLCRYYQQQSMAAALSNWDKTP